MKRNMVLVNITTVFMQFLLTYLFTVFGGFFAGMMCIELNEAGIGIAIGIIGVLSMMCTVLFRNAMITELAKNEQEEN